MPSSQAVDSDPVPIPDLPEIDLQAAWESVPDGLLLVDVEGRIRWANTEVEALFGLSSDELVSPN